MPPTTNGSRPRPAIPRGRGERLADEVGGRELDLGLDDIDEVMGDAPPLLEGRLVGADIEAPCRPGWNRR